MRLTSHVEHQLDQKARMRIPPKFRALLGNEQVVIVTAPEGCLNLYSSEEFERVEEILNRIPKSDLQAQKVKRSILMSVFIPTEDSQGRFVVPQYLRDYAHIVKDITFVGMGDVVEIWASEQLSEYQGGAMDAASLEQNIGLLEKYGY